MGKGVFAGARQWLVAGLLGAACVLAVLPVAARQAAPGVSTAISVDELPSDGRSTYVLIRQGGPFAHEKDGSVFGNYERQLPVQRRGYYREYTVRTPGAHSRGARRIVCGGAQRAPDVCYYTGDHYSSFKRIAP